MDLSFARATALSRGGVTALPTDLAVLLVGVAARQAVSPTAQAQARLAFQRPMGDRMAPPEGAFHALVAAWLRRWQDE